MTPTQSVQLLQRIANAEALVIDYCGISHFARSLFYFEKGCQWAEDNSPSHQEAMLLQTSPEYWALFSIEWMKREEFLLDKIHYCQKSEMYEMEIIEHKEVESKDKPYTAISVCTKITLFRDTHIKKGYVIEMGKFVKALKPNQSIIELIIKNGEKNENVYY